MSSSTVGAKSIERQDLSCYIECVTCKYNADDEEKTAVLYDRDKAINENRGADELVGTSRTPSDGTLYGGICYISSEYNYYFISNHHGKGITLDCERKVHCCNEEEHALYQIDACDINSTEIKTERKPVSQGDVKLYYYNLFHRQQEYAAFGAKMMRETDYSDNEITQAIVSTAMAGAGYLVGNEVGDIADTLFSLRFFTLPTLTDNKYYCYASLIYFECPHVPGVPLMTINIYPDIKFTLKFGFKGQSSAYNKGYTDKYEKQTDKFEFEFTVTYAETTKEISLGTYNETNVGKEERDGLAFYKAIEFFKDLFAGAANMTNGLISVFGGESRTGKDLTAVEAGLAKGSNAFGNSFKWLKGSFEFLPSIDAEWKYKTTDDLTTLQKHLKIDFGLSCEGTLTIDLVELYDQICTKAEKTTTVVAMGASVMSGGLLALPAALLTFLAKTLIMWLKVILKRGFKAEIQFKGTAVANAISFDSLAKKKLDFDKITVGPEIKITVGVEYKTSLVFGIKTTSFGFAIPVMDFELQDMREDEEVRAARRAKQKTKDLDNKLSIKGEAAATVEAAVSMEWEANVDFDKGVLGLNNTFRIRPFTLTANAYALGGWSIERSGFELWRDAKGLMTQSWGFEEIEKGPYLWTWFDTKEEGPAKESDKSSGGDTGGGGGGGSW